VTELQWKAALAGLFFGIWPLLMNRSGLPGNVSSAMFAMGVALLILPFGVREARGSAFHIAWVFVILACMSGAKGILSFNGMLAKASQQEVGSLFLVMIVVQITVPALYDAIINRGVSWEKALGFAFAIVTTYLLTRK
jgi:hypothetical protein